jgi:caspase-like apoptosis-related cysteine protease
MSVDKEAPFYNMNHKRRGIAIIFNHEEFDNHPRGNGTNVDLDSLENTLIGLGFEAKVYHDLDFENIMKIVDEG